MVIAGTVLSFQKSLLDPDEERPAEKKAEKIPLITMFRHEAFSSLLAANLLRGFASGTTTILAAAALSIGYDETLTSAMVSAQSLAMLSACALFALISKRIHPRYVILFGSFCFLALPALLFKNQPILFLILYALLLFGRTLIDYAVPAALLYAVPVEIAGTYNAWRMILHNGGTMLATMLAGFVPLPVMLVVSLIFQLISGFNFCMAKVMKKKQELN
jgi:MFS family permease